MNNVQCRLSCECWTTVRVDLAVLYTGQACRFHGERYITKVNTHEWRVRCPQCRYGRWCGQDRRDALRRQLAHHDAYAGHMPSVAYDRVTYDGGGSILRWDGRRPRKGPATVTERPIRVDIPPPY